jgi:hypothetical protein
METPGASAAAAPPESWLSTIKKGVVGAIGEEKWKEEKHWTDFIVNVVLSFKDSEFDEDEIITAVAVLVSYGVRNENGLKGITGNPPDWRLFKDSLEGILPAICDRLYETAVFVKNDSEAGKPPEPKKQILKRVFDIDLLLSPLEV